LPSKNFSIGVRPQQIFFNEYQDFNYGYAATVHKSQGSTYDHVFVYVAGRAWDRFLSYVAMTRHRKSLNVYAEAMNIGAVKLKQESFKYLAPNLSDKLEAFVKFKTRQKEIGRDFD
jgi:ATP-dependent exoDNAse (exonuclease V) alpha subunit